MGAFRKSFFEQSAGAGPSRPGVAAPFPVLWPGRDPPGSRERRQRRVQAAWEPWAAREGCCGTLASSNGIIAAIGCLGVGKDGDPLF